MLTKRHRVTVIPGVPAVPHQPAHQVCTGGPPVTSPPSGRWVTVCGYDYVPVGVIYGPTPGVYPPDPGPFPKTIYMQVYACKSVWVP
ncbi:MAG: hypothetical protein GX856_08825 [Gammaproteobacteria bacterium]|nr:hypothetical protein [Gammaproteobacteria bacterium]